MSFAMASMVMMGVGAVTGAVGAGISAESQQSSLGFEAGIADINARMSEQSAQSELMRGEREYQSSRLRTGQLKGRQRASLAANGVDLGVGSAAEILTSTDVMGEIDANTIQANAIRAAWGHRTQSTGYQNEALMKRTSASSIDPGKAMFSTLLSEGTKVAGSYMSMKSSGAFGGSGSKTAAAPKSTGTTYSGTPLTSNWG
jgi:hypothetical protein